MIPSYLILVMIHKNLIRDGIDTKYLILVSLQKAQGQEYTEKYHSLRKNFSKNLLFYITLA